MKKKGLVITALVMALSLSACGNKADEGSSDKDNTVTEAATEAATESAGATDEKTEASSEAAGSTEEKVETAKADSGVVGRYNLFEYEANGQTVTNDLLKQAGMDKTYLELYEDGTGKFNLFESLLDITWKDGKITVYGTSDYGFTVEGDTLKLDMQGMIYTMNRDGSVSADASDKTEDKTEGKSEEKTEAKSEEATETGSKDEKPASSEVPGGNGIVSEEKLQKGYVWLSKINKDPFNTTYEELADYYGVEGAFDKEEYSERMQVNKRYYKWISEDNDTHFIYVNFEEKEPGVYKISGYNSSGFLASDAEDAYLEELQSEAKEADKESASNAEMTEASYEIFEFGSKDNSVKVTLEQPSTGWAWDEKKVKLVESDDINTFGAGFIQFEVKPEVEKFDFYKDKFENYADIEDREIGGITMKGRTYDYIGYSFTEYNAQLTDGKAIAVKIVRVDIDEGTMGDKILDSIKFEY